MTSLAVTVNFMGAVDKTKGLTLDMEIQLFSGLVLYGFMEAVVLEILNVTHSPVWREVLIVSSVSILNFPALRNLFRLVRSSIGLHQLFGLGIKNSL